MGKGKEAKELFLQGYNCSQSVVGAYAGRLGMDFDVAMKTASSFGGGMGRLREVCGAVSGMFFVAGALYGYEDPKDPEAKKEHYERIQLLASRFKKEAGSIICRELLGLDGKDTSPTPSERTEEYYKKRPCPDKVALAAKILEEYIKEEERKSLMEQFEFRTIHKNETDEAAQIEQICFPPHEACSKQAIKDRVENAPELFLVAVDKKNSKIAGFLNGLATDEVSFRDEFFTDVKLHNPGGRHIMLLGLDVLPEYRNRGLAREIICQYLKRERENGRELLVLTCLEEKVDMYKKMGFSDGGIANSSWGGEEWHEMRREVGEGVS